MSTAATRPESMHEHLDALQAAAENLLRHAGDLQVQSERFFAEARRLREEIARLRKLDS